MPDEIATEPVVVPPADQPPPGEPVKEKSFGERWAAMEDSGESTETTPDKPAAPAAKPAAKATPGDPKEAKRSQLKALAAELGLTIDDGGVTTADAIEVRAQKRRNQAWKAEQEAALAKRESELGEKVKKSQAIFDAYERGDPEGFAQALGAKSFDELQQSWIKRIADPNYMELRRLQQEVDARKAKEEKDAEEAQTRAQQQKTLEIRRNYMRTLSETCKNSQDPLLQALHDDMGFLSDIFQVQKENWDEDAQRTISVEEAIKRVRRNNAPSVRDNMQRFYERLHKAFGSPAAETAAPAAAKLNGKKPAPKTAVTPPNTVEGGAAAPKPSDPGWREYALRRMKEAEG